jgi:hypothetical protein
LNTAAKDSEKQTNREYFSLDPSYINTEIVKNIGIDPAINSILAEVNHDLIVQTIRLDDFAEKTIGPLKKQLCSLLNCDKMQKMAIINSVITCINRNIEAVKDSQRHSNGNTDNNIPISTDQKEPQNPFC